MSKACQPPRIHDQTKRNLDSREIFQLDLGIKGILLGVSWNIGKEDINRDKKSGKQRVIY